MAQKIEYSAKFKRNYVSFFAFTLFFLMIITEFVSALSIPRLIRRENAFADEIRKRELVLLFDATREKCKKIPEHNDAVKNEKELLSATLDHLAIYLRKESSRLTRQDVAALSPLIAKLDKIAERLHKNRPYSNQGEINSSKYINALVKEYENKQTL